MMQDSGYFYEYRSIDVMRVCQSILTNAYDVKTPRKEILKYFNEIILDIGNS